MSNPGYPWSYYHSHYQNSHNPIDTPKRRLCHVKPTRRNDTPTRLMPKFWRNPNGMKWFMAISNIASWSFNTWKGSFFYPYVEVMLYLLTENMYSTKFSKCDENMNQSFIHEEIIFAKVRVSHMPMCPLRHHGTSIRQRGTSIRQRGTSLALWQFTYMIVVLIRDFGI